MATTGGLKIPSCFSQSCALRDSEGSMPRRTWNTRAYGSFNPFLIQ